MREVQALYQKQICQFWPCVASLAAWCSFRGAIILQFSGERAWQQWFLMDVWKRSPNPLFLLFILVLFYFCVLDSFSLSVSLKWGVGSMALDGSSSPKSPKIHQSIRSWSNAFLLPSRANLHAIRSGWWAELMRHILSGDGDDTDDTVYWWNDETKYHRCFKGFSFNVQLQH